MNGHALSGAVISPAQITGLGHLLAAANHRQWVVWESFVLRNRELFASRDPHAILTVAAAGGVNRVLAAHARAVIAIVERAVGDFAYAPTIGPVLERKQQQFTGWVNYAVTKTDDDLERWLLQCRTPFLKLSPDMQVSDYAEAEADLVVIADAGGLVLARPRPALVPQTLGRLRTLRRWHALGRHGRYRASEEAWTGFCNGCHASWNMTP